MTTRRHFIQTLAAVPPALSLGTSWAASDPSRLALVIGNSQYLDAPLVNPVNDARAMAALLDQAGFKVASHLNARRTDMMAAIERFAADIRKSETQQVIFYYAGHGAQLDWRNYLLPVDAQADTAAQLRQSCIDLNYMIGEFNKAKGKTFIIILDACRNNPFGSSYQPEQKGLSQFDAPVGSLLAYATSPGNVAADGSGSNGLYTENLLRELSVKGARIEDALKRVRLNVRLASQGAQIPWETTSLEQDIFIFDASKNKLSEAEQEQLLEQDLAEWTRVKGSGKIDDYAGYLRKFPNGRFAEMVQARLSRLLAETERVRVAEAERAREQAEADKARLLAEAEKARQQAEAEKARLLAEAEQARQRAEAERARQQAEAERQRRQAEAEQARRLAEAEKQRLQAEAEQARLREAEKARVLAEAEKARLRAAELARQQAEAEKARVLAEAEKARQLAEAERAHELARAEDERQRAEAEKARRLAEAEKALKAAEAEKQRLQTAAQSAKPQASSAVLADGTPQIRLGPNLPVPMFMEPTNNPFSAGRYPLGRNFVVGDTATVRISDTMTDVVKGTRTAVVTRVDVDGDRVEFNDGQLVSDLMGNGVRNGPVVLDAPTQEFPGELYVGKKWSAIGRRNENGVVSDFFFDYHVARRETITVPAGRFDTFVIEGEGWNRTFGSRLTNRLWVVPGLNFTVRRENIGKNARGFYFRTERIELVEAVQHGVDRRCAAPASGMAQRNLVIKSNCGA